LPRPRSVEVLTSAEFMRLKRQIMGSIHDEALRSFMG
jgi:hypothetical protein